jgi:hypothetical protein
MSQSLSKTWIHLDFIKCTQYLKHTSEHFDELLTCLLKSTGRPEKDFIYNQIVKIINETFNDDEHQAKEIRRQVRKSINEYLIETAQHV